MATENNTIPKELFELIGSPVKEVAEAAFKAVELRSKRSTHAISEAEYNELFDDITRLETINQAMFTEEVYLKIKQAYTVIMTLKSITSLI